MSQKPVETKKPDVLVEKPVDDEHRPWHGSDNPLEALYQWVKAELDGLKNARHR